MPNKSVILGIIAVIGVVLGGYLYFSGQMDWGLLPSMSPTGEEPASARVVFSVTDATTAINNVSEVSLTVDKVEAESTTQGWVTVSEVPKKYNLLALHTSSMIQVLADAKLDVGKYNQVRLHVSDVTVLEKNGSSKKAKLPSSQLKIVGGFTVQGGTTSSVLFDFLADQSLHVTGKGEYIFAPVVKLTTKSNAQVGIDSADTVSIDGGVTETTVSAGMDIDGSVNANFVLDGKADLELTGALIRVKTKGEKSDAGLKITAEKAADLAVEAGHLDVAVSVQLTMFGTKKVWRVSGLKGLLPASANVDATTGVVAAVQ